MMGNVKELIHFKKVEKEHGRLLAQIIWVQQALLNGLRMVVLLELAEIIMIRKLSLQFQRIVRLKLCAMCVQN